MPALISEDQIQKDIALIERVSNNDSTALSELYDKHATLMYSIIMRILVQREEAETVLQKVFQAIWNGSEKYHLQFGGPGMWLARLARDYAVERLKSKDYKFKDTSSTSDKSKDVFSSEYSTNMEHQMSLSSLQEDILIAITTLSREQKGFIELAYLKGFSQSDLAEYLRLPVGTIKSRVRTTVSILRQKLRHHLS